MPAKLVIKASHQLINPKKLKKCLKEKLLSLVPREMLAAKF